MTSVLLSLFLNSLSHLSAIRYDMRERASTLLPDMCMLHANPYLSSPFKQGDCARNELVTRAQGLVPHDGYARSAFV